MGDLLIGLGVFLLGLLILLAGQKVLERCLRRDKDNGPDYGLGGLLLFTGIMLVLCGTILMVFTAIWIGLVLFALIVTT